MTPASLPTDRTPQADFVLFPTRSTRPARRHPELQLATSSTAPSAHPGATPSGRQHHHLFQRRHSARQSASAASSPLQNPRVRHSIQGTGPGIMSSSPSANPHGHPQQHNFYASSAPSSSVALRHQQPHPSRPPVPLFHSTDTMRSHHPSLSMLDSTDGEDSPPSFTTSMSLTPPAELAHSLLDYDADDFEMITSHAPQFFDFSGFPMQESMSVQVPANPQTVSPKDIFAEAMSAPGSSALTNLSTPGTYPFDSPYGIIPSANTSPMFATEILDDDAENWAPLFPQESPSSGSNFAVDDAAQPSIEAMGPPMSRHPSSPGQSSRSMARHSSINGVSSRKRDKPLAQIPIPDPHDTVAIKRARNTAAARKSRAKKVEKMEEMQETIDRLEAEVQHWKDIALARTGGSA